MVYNRRRRRTMPLAQSPRPTAQYTSVPAPYGGINAIGAISSLPPEDCIYTYNMMPADLGMRLRQGYKEWANGIGFEVRTVIPFEGSASDGSGDRLFVAAEDGIYDVSSFGDTSPTKVLSFSTTDATSGFGVKAAFTNDAQNHFIFYADETNGLFRYDEAGGTWAVAAGITGVAAADIAFVTTHKQRVWLVERDNADAWYLPVDSIAGAATKFTFGAKFTHGGQLMGLWSWTVDGGDGVDDYLVGVSRAGDTLVYKGADPSVADWELVGSYFIGQVPNSRNIGMPYGPDLYILSIYGVSSIRAVLQGATMEDLAGSPTAKISGLLRAAIALAPESPIWSMAHFPGDDFLQIVAPKRTNQPYIQYTQNTTNRGWGMWRDVPILCAGTWRGRYYFGTVDGNIYTNEGPRDGSLLDGTVGEPVEYSLLTSFNHLGNPGLNKQIALMRVVGISGNAEKVTARVLWDYDVRGQAWKPGLPDPNLGAVWDTDLWDVGIWDSPIVGKSTIIGGEGIGRVAALAIRGRATARVFLTQIDLVYSGGGFL